MLCPYVVALLRLSFLEAGNEKRSWAGLACGASIVAIWRGFTSFGTDFR